ncbi:hypothetical protein [Pontimonas salivibrio]|nr:hypothetical protein [Pontimonas salivibrio]
MSRTGTRGRMARLILGLGIVGISVGGVWWVVGSVNHLEPYLIATQDVTPGQRLADVSTQTVYLGTPSGNPGLLTPEALDTHGSLIAETTLSRGSVLLEGHFVQPAPSDQSAFSVQVSSGGAGWLNTGHYVDVWISAPMENQQFAIPVVAAPAARIVAIRAEEGFAANPEVVRVDLAVTSRDLPALVHALANGFDIQLSPAVDPRLEPSKEN